MEQNKGKLPLFTGIDGLKIRRQVVPGDTLLLETEFAVFRRGVGKVNVRASVGGETAVEGVIKFAIADPKGKDEMRVFAISDLHLALAEDKPMDIFGLEWKNYMQRIQENWQQVVSEEDLVLLPEIYHGPHILTMQALIFNILNSFPERRSLQKETMIIGGQPEISF